VEDDEVVNAEGDGVLIELRLSKLRLCEGSEVDLEGLVGEAVGMGVGEAAEALRGAGEVFVVQLGDEETIYQKSFAGEVDEWEKSRGRAVAVDVAVGYEERADAGGVLGEEDLGGDASAVVGDEVDGVDLEPVEEGGEHGGLGVGRDGLVGVGLGVAEAHEVGSDATAVGVKMFEGTAPLIAVEWIAVEEEGGGALADIDVGHAGHGEIGETAIAVIPGGVEGSGLSGDEVGCGDDGGCGVFEEVSASHEASIRIGAEIYAHVRTGGSTNGWKRYVDVSGVRDPSRPLRDSFA